MVSTVHRIVQTQIEKEKSQQFKNNSENETREEYDFNFFADAYVDYGIKNFYRISFLKFMNSFKVSERVAMVKKAKRVCEENRKAREAREADFDNFFNKCAERFSAGQRKNSLTGCYEDCFV